MKKLFYKIVKVVLRRIFPIIESIKKENEHKKVLCLLPNLISCGDSINLGPDWRIEGCEYISIGERFSAGMHLRVEAIDFFGGVTYCPSLKVFNINFSLLGCESHRK